MWRIDIRGTWISRTVAAGGGGGAGSIPPFGEKVQRNRSFYTLNFGEIFFYYFVFV